MPLWGEDANQQGGRINTAAILSDTFGRRWGVTLGLIVVLVGTVIQAVPAVNEGMFIGGRFLVGLGYVLASTRVAQERW
jgi:MFS family permease